MGSGPKVDGKKTGRPVAAAQPVGEISKGSQDALAQHELPAGWNTVSEIDSVLPVLLFKKGVKKTLDDGTEVVVTTFPGQEVTVEMDGKTFYFKPSEWNRMVPTKDMMAGAVPGANSYNYQEAKYGPIVSEVEQAIKEWRSDPLNKPAAGGEQRIQRVVDNLPSLLSNIPTASLADMSDDDFIKALKNASTVVPKITSSDALENIAQSKVMLASIAKFLQQDAGDVMRSLSESGRSPAALRAAKDYFQKTISAITADVAAPIAEALNRSNHLDNGYASVTLSGKQVRSYDEVSKTLIDNTINGINSRLRQQMITAKVPTKIINQLVPAD